MDGIIFVIGLIGVVAVAGIRSKGTITAPGLWLTLAIVAGSLWYVMA